MTDNPFSWFYFPTALILGALHALEPGHAKTLTAAYLIGIKGNKKDAWLLGLSVAITHSAVVVALCVAALWLGRETFTNDVMYWLQIGSGVLVILLGFWMLFKRLKIMKKQKLQAHHGVHDETHHHSHEHHHDHDHVHHHRTTHDHDHSAMSDDEHARAHAATIPEYVKRGERPSRAQIMAFGAAGGMIPCPASITVMLLALSVGEYVSGFITVAGFSIGLAITLVGIGLAVVTGINQFKKSDRFMWIPAYAPLMSAAVVILSGLISLIFIH